MPGRADQLSPAEDVDFTTDYISSPVPASTQSRPPSKSIGFEFDLAHHHSSCLALVLKSV